MQELDDWTQEVIIEPLMEDLGGVVGVEANLQIRRAIRAKMLESYRNGQQAGPPKPVAERRKAYQR